MSSERFKLLLVGVAVLAVAVLVSSGIKIPGSGLVAAVIDAITDTTPIEPATVLIESVPADSAPTTPAEPAPTDTALAEPAPAAPTGISNFTEVLQAVTESVKNFVEPVLVPVPVAPKSVSRFNLKVFVQDQETLESAVNNWFAVQEGIVVDQLNVQDYGGGGYLVVVSYHTGGTGNSSTRLKLIAGENPEADAQAFLSSLGASQTVRSVAAVAGSYSGPQTTVTIPIIFIVYE